MAETEPQPTDPNDQPDQTDADANLPVNEGQADVDAALNEAKNAVNDIQQMAEEAQPASAEDVLRAMVEEAGDADQPQALDTPDFSAQSAGDAAPGLDLLHDVDLNVTIELGRTEMLVEDVLKLNQGSVVELDKLAGDPVDVYVNQRLVARGEVLVLNDNFCIRIGEIVADLDEQAKQVAQQQASEVV